MINRTEALYRVTWVIDLYAESPKEAAELAFAIQRDTESIATAFAIENLDLDIDESQSALTKTVLVDLSLFDVEEQS